MATEIYFTGQSGAIWRYWTDRTLGSRGNFGVVYAAEGSDGIPMAVKVVEKQRPYGVLDDRLLRREVEIGRRVAASGAEMLLPVVDAAETSDSLLLVMVRADGALDDKLRAVRLEEPEVISVMIDLATGLEELRAIRIVHRDLKPANVLLHKGRWKLADFGIARDEEVGTQNLTFIGWGSHPYMAPELWMLESPTGKTDLYAFGCVAYQLVVGQPPYPGDREAAREGHLTSPLPEVPASNSVLKSLIAWLIAKKPGDRPQDAQAVLKRLRSFSLELSPAQIVIRSRLAERAEERSRRAAQRAADKTVRSAAAQGHRQLIMQARADLSEIVKDTFERLRMAAPDATFKTTGPSMYLSAEAVRLRIDFHGDTGSYWPFPSRSDAMVAFGSVLIPGVSENEPPRGLDPENDLDRDLANLIYEKLDGRLVWHSYRLASGALPVPKSILDKPGIKFNLDGTVSVIKPDVPSSTVAEFTAEALLDMFVEALDI